MRARAGTGGFVRRHRVTIASWSALVVVGGVLTAYAITADGYPTHKAELNDGGVWVTNQAMGALGRQNVPVAQIDARVFDGQDATKLPSLDVIQDGSAVFSIDRTSGSVMPIDVSMGAGLKEQRVVGGGPDVFYGGGSLAVMDPGNGRLWATTVDPDTGTGSLGELARSAKPLARVGDAAVGAAGRDGTVYAASADGRLVTIHRGPAGAGFAKPARSALGGELGTLRAMTVVGDVPVVLDEAGNARADSGSLGNLGRAAALQQPGPHSDEVVVATPEALLAVPLEGGKPRELADVGAHEWIASPVVMPNGCTFAAWAAGSTGTLAAACGTGEADTHTFKVTAGAHLVFRVNRNQVVLNDETTGTTWSVADAAPQQIDNWDAFREQPAKKDERDSRKSAEQQAQPPQAKPDDLGARVGRTTVLNVLDNDLIASDGVLSVVDVKDVDRTDVDVRIAPDRQSVLATVAGGADGVAHFTYTVDDGTGDRKSSQSDGEVTLHLRRDDGSGTPRLRPHAPARTFPVTAGGVVEFAVTPDWRDPAYGDPVVVDAVKASGGLEVSTTAVGMVRVEAEAGSKGGLQTIGYDVTTGGAKVAGQVQVEVVAAGGKTVAARAESDVVSGEAGAPITVRPLDNDIPGADGSDPGAELALAGQVAPAGGLTVETDLESGRVVVTGSTPGTYFLDYNAGFGAAKRAPGRSRVDSAPPSKDSATPVATPDNANVHGMSPTIVDVLANDYDPKGRMLVVQQARASSPRSQLEVAVVDGRWVRVQATDPAISPASQSVTYTISNGVGTAEGSISVVQREALTGLANAPVTQVDRVTVRAGDTASIPVLDNDTTPSGDPVGLVSAPTTGATGELPVLGPARDSGAAYVSGRQVRFVAPEKVDGATDVEVQYVAENTGDPTAPSSIGTVKVHVTPPPSDTNPDQAPTPRAIEGRVAQGDTVTLKLPPIGSDPDGDSVAVSAIATPPTSGRVLSYGANSITYQAFPDGEGTDELRYTVTDRFGKTGSATARVAVVPAGAPQPPVAVDDELVAAPGRTVTIDVLANDLRARGANIRVLPLGEGAPAPAKLLGDNGPIEVVAPEDGRTTRVVYTVTNGLAESRAVVAVTGRDGYNNPPVVGDIYARPGASADSVTVDALAGAVDLDGPEDELELVDVTGDAITAGATGSEAASGTEAAGVRIEGGKVVVPLTGVAQVLAYTVKDGDDALAAAAIYVPARATGAPYLKPGARITLDPDSDVTEELDDLVVDPEGDPVRLTVTETLSTSPEERGLDVEAPDTTSLKLTSSKSEGPGAVTFEVVDRKDLDARDAHRAFISVPVQVGESDPVVSCPDQPIEVPEGGVSRTVDVASVCHVWTPDPADADELEFTADWLRRIPGVDVASVDGGGLRFEASGDAHRGDVGRLEVAAKGHDATGTLSVLVVPLPEARMAPIRLDTKVGKPVTVDVAQFLTSPLPASSRDVSIVSALPVGGASAVAEHEGSKLTLTPRKDTHGVMRYRLSVSDVKGSTTSGRAPATGEVTLAVVDRPSPPTNLRVGTELLANTVALTWTTPENNGERIDTYEVSYGGEKFSCPGSPCRVTGLENGKEYAFSVKAHNAVGWSDASGVVRGRADAFTGPVRNPRVVLARDHSIRVQWDAPAPCDCSPVRKYQISAPGLVTTVDAAQRTYDVPATNGENTTITIVPLNDKGMKEHTGPRASVTGVAAGAPAAPAQPAVTGTNVAGGSQKAVKVSWSPVGPNGPAPVRYQVTRNGKVVCDWSTSTQCQDTNLTNDGTTYTYAVRAKNAEADSPREANGGAQFHTSPFSPGKAIEASAPPVAPVITALAATGTSGQARITFNVGNSHGKSNQVTCYAQGRSCGSWSFARAGAQNVTKTISGLANTPQSVTLKACNGGTSNLCTTSAARSVSPYGDIGAVSISASAPDRTVTWTFNVNANGKAAQWKVQRRHEGDPTWYQIAEGTTSAGAYSKSGSAFMSENATYYYRVTVWDAGRSTRTDETSVHVPSVPGPSVNATKGNGCGSNCWEVLGKGWDFKKDSYCTVHLGTPTSPGSQVGQRWLQGLTWKGTGVNMQAYRQFHIRCANGAISRAYTFFP